MGPEIEADPEADPDFSPTGGYSTIEEPVVGKESTEEPVVVV